MMNRHHVYLSGNLTTAGNAGIRNYKLVILTVDSQTMIADRHVFYQSDNAVWLTDEALAKYISEIDK